MNELLKAIKSVVENLSSEQDKKLNLIESIWSKSTSEVQPTVEYEDAFPFVTASVIGVSLSEDLRLATYKLIFTYNDRHQSDYSDLIETHNTALNLLQTIILRLVDNDQFEIDSNLEAKFVFDLTTKNRLVFGGGNIIVSITTSNSR